MIRKADLIAQCRIIRDKADAGMVLLYADTYNISIEDIERINSYFLSIWGEARDIIKQCGGKADD